MSAADEILRYFERADLAARDRRNEAIRNYGFSVPTRGAVRWIARRSGGKLLEVGAGTGYWSCVLASMGVHVVATDPNDHPHGFVVGTHFPVQSMDAVSAVIAMPDYPVLVSWPSLHASWAADMAGLVQTKLFYIGELNDGCCANDEFFEALERRFDETGSIDIPTWRGMHDYRVIEYIPKHSEAGNGATP